MSSSKPEFGEAYAAEQLRRSRHPLRRLVKRFYLDNVLEEVIGATIDFGCGAGQLLRRLPTGSTGFEVNPFLVEQLQKEGLDVIYGDPRQDHFALDSFAPGRYRSLVMSHVLEHFDDVPGILRRVLDGSARLGVERVVVVVPGERGYKSDATHKTFVTLDYLGRSGLLEHGGYRAARSAYFPIDHASIGSAFVFHELKVVYERAST